MIAATEPKSAEILIALLKGPLKSGFQSMLQKKLYGALSTTLNQVRAAPACPDGIAWHARRDV